ncbi:Putative MutT-family protein [Microbacterium esteraromaticum]|uniref:Putative MutT-family protein n=1 Tax=Microbacterium esteraromaticum TaxID=57043 RepID=A0A1R4KE72_9MICO|nr:NUDIX domain-containing protein [Microbacterium esteraromaticum]SJN42671.1 Putative MutT-family protein [Microbacterium esteraromaticum]
MNERAQTVSDSGAPAPHTFALIPAAYVYLRSAQGVLLQLRQNTGYMDGCWAAGAAGHIERGETAVQAAIRELREELGVTVEPAALHWVAVMQRTDGTENPREQRVDWFFTCDEWRGEPTIAEPQKCGGLAWHPLDDLPQEMPPHERRALEAVDAGGSTALLSFGPA